MQGPLKTSLLVTYPDDISIREAKSLADAAGYCVIKTVTQQNITHSRYGIGRGKAQEIKDLVDQLRVNIVIYDEVLKPSQQYNLASLCKLDIIDRERLILQIFELRASNNESRIQTKLAQLRYDMVRVRDKVRLAKKGEQPGFFGMGKYDAEVYFLDIRRRAAVLKRKLEKEETRRRLYRTQRSRVGLPTISIVGYTSAGKTRLFNTLTGESKDVGQGIFTTLSTNTRAINLKGNKVLMSDTVGFISKLPAYMIDAFKSTLNELMYSVILFLVLDVSEPIDEMRRKLHSSMHVLNEFGVGASRILLVLNKIDAVNSIEVSDKVTQLSITDNYRSLAISAKTGYNMAQLKELMAQVLASDYINPSKISLNTYLPSYYGKSNFEPGMKIKKTTTKQE